MSRHGLIFITWHGQGLFEIEITIIVDEGATVCWKKLSELELVLNKLRVFGFENAAIEIVFALTCWRRLNWL
jgi:hypothetical protein